MTTATVAPAGRLRAAQSRCLDPLARWLARRGVAPWAVTLVGLVCGVACGVAVWQRWYPIAALAWAAAALADVVDGPLARTSGRANRRGAALDTTCDRIVDDAPLLGFLASGVHVTAAACALTVVWLPALVSWAARRRGVTVSGGPMGRAQRAVVQFVALAVPALAGVSLWTLAAGAAVTAAWRAVRWALLVRAGRSDARAAADVAATGRP